MVSAFLSAALSVGIAPLLAHADARTDYLVRLLRTSEAFRVRAQAALSLGSVAAEPQVIEALTGALRDSEPAVRAAAASSLERLGDPSALPALRAASSDRERAVAEAARSAVRALERVARSGSGAGTGTGTTTASTGATVEPRGTPRFYVGVGMPGTKVAAIDRSVLASARGFIASRVQQLEGVVVAPDSETPRQAQQVIRQRSLTGFYLDSSIVSLETRPDGGVRAQVSVVVQTYPDRNVRSMLNGAATVMGETGVAAQRAAIEGALNGALRNLGTAMGAGSPR
ncbi:PBS lyase HEAT repeat-like domain protein [Sandaracinus amylolyticus]|uniref:PBS lyase HEAT repeat-like domain protein n=1 Tax=Sandaracinus amylolyticus TaxID=927083 RepID=A0A0F6YKB3_9BACT|nr:PBS lyase HEAT repeat-like domain protein [Sandaracinus amylolyticus]